MKHYQAYTYSLTTACGLTSYEVSREDKTFEPSKATCDGCKDEIQIQAVRDRVASAPNPPEVR